MFTSCSVHLRALYRTIPMKRNILIENLISWAHIIIHIKNSTNFLLSVNDVGWNLPPSSVMRWVIAQVLLTSNSYDQNVNSRMNSLQFRKDDVDRKANDSIKTRDDSYLSSLAKKAITRVSDLGLEQALWGWKDNSKIYKVMFQESFLILMFTRSKEPPFASCFQAVRISLFRKLP
jgi:hypothetical protein